MRILLFLFLSCISLQGFAQIPSFVTDSLEDYIQEGMENWDIPAVSVGIIKDGQIHFVKGFGTTAKDGNEAVDENTLFMIGSNSKAFIGLSMAMLANEGTCRLDDPVKKYYPNLKLWDPWLTENMNLTDILSHRVGMETFQGDFMYWSSTLNREQCIEKFGQLEPTYDFRTQWGYCNAGYALASACIDHMYVKGWKAYIENNIFDPLEMERSCLSGLEMKSIENSARPYVMNNGKLVEVPYPSLGGIEAAGSIGSSAEEMLHWMQMQLDKGKYKGSQVIPAEVIETTHTPVSLQGLMSHPFNKTVLESYALGWEVIDDEGRMMVRHTGGVDGFVSSVTLIPEEELGIVILTNTLDNLLFVSLREELVDAYLDLPFRDYDQLYFNYMERVNSKTEEVYQNRLDTIASIKKLDLKPALYVGTHPSKTFFDALNTC